jgi:glucose/arabinose dehydrogenase
MRARRLILIGLLGIAVLANSGTLMAARGQGSDQDPGVFRSPHLTLTPVIRGLKEPTFVAWPTDDSGRVFVLERGGLVRLAAPDGQLQPRPFLDLSQEVSLGNEEGLLGLAFDPAFAQNGNVYVDYTAQDLSINIVRYTASSDHPDVVDPTTVQRVLSIPKRSKYHQAGMLEFGPDGDLYISVGDDEQSDRAQDLGVLTGKILRIDVDSAQPYVIPPTNPFVDTDARGEIWSYGLRNPWRFSFDRATGDMWIGDVHHVDDGPGSDSNWETVDFQPAGAAGLNYGFPMRATFHCTDIASCRPPGVTLPVTQFDHNMKCSITGGYVYRGSAIPSLTGAYIFGDLCTGGVFAVRGSAAQPWSKQLELGYQPIKISSFGEDLAGELYVADIQSGVIYRITDASLP